MEASPEGRTEVKEGKDVDVGGEEMPTRPPKERKIEVTEKRGKARRKSSTSGGEKGAEAENPAMTTATIATAAEKQDSAPQSAAPATSASSKGKQQAEDDQTSSGGGGGGAAAPGGKKKKPRRRQRHRRGGRHSHHQTHKWKPYDKLTWAERKALEERETRRALRVRQERFAIGLPVAPYNTTQFLMEDHNNDGGEPKLTPPHLIPKKKEPRERRCSAPGGSADEACPGGEKCECPEASESDEYEYDDDYVDSAFLAKEEEEFSQAYDKIHAESLHNMSKNQLVIEYMELEAKLEEMTKNIRREDSPWPIGQRLYHGVNNESGPVFNYTHSPIRSANTSTTTEEEMTTLREKVEALEKENKRMKEEMRRLSCMNAVDSTSATETVTMASVDDGGGGGIDGLDD